MVAYMQLPPPRNVIFWLLFPCLLPTLLKKVDVIWNTASRLRQARDEAIRFWDQSWSGSESGINFFFHLSNIGIVKLTIKHIITQNVVGLMFVVILSIHQNCDINALPHPKRGSVVGEATGTRCSIMIIFFKVYNVRGHLTLKCHFFTLYGQSTFWLGIYDVFFNFWIFEHYKITYA